MDGYLYGRGYRVLVADKENRALDVSDLRCVFQVRKTYANAPNICECAIYNLAPGTEKKLIEEGQRLIVEAGYDSKKFTEEKTAEGKTTRYSRYQRYGIIFDGDVFQVIRELEDGVSYKLTIQAIDGDKFNYQNKINVTLPINSSPRTVISAIAKSSGVPIETGKISADLSAQRLPRGKVLFGDPKKYLDQVAGDNRAAMWIEDSKLNVVKFTDPPPLGEAIVITPGNGMVGAPRQNGGGVELRCLLDPRIKIAGLIKIDNEIVRRAKVVFGQPQTMLDKDGIYAVSDVAHTGDSRGGEWYTDIKGVAMGTGRTPLLMATAAQTLR
jgi:hypothetical protein